MCENEHRVIKGRFGSSLKHGRAHAEDHRRWTRRDFLSGLGALSAGALLLGKTPVQAYGMSPLLNKLNQLEEDRILVLIQLKGGNDGLNTVVPFNDDLYYNLRPDIAISKSDAEAFKVSNDLGMHPSLTPLQSLYGDGKMAIIQNAGYPEPTLSHFRSTDIWQTATDHDVIKGTGWLGRYLDIQSPDFIEAPPERPLAVQIGNGSAQLFNGPNADMGMHLFSNEYFERLKDGTLYDQNAVPETMYGGEMGFLRSISNNSFRYAEAISVASSAGENSVEYPEGVDGKLDKNLSTVARLIKGNLGAKIYHVALQGFDTHSGQLEPHTELLSVLARVVDAFIQDIAIDNPDTKVLTMTYSEFGRRIGQNGSEGTDHGEGAPLFLFGEDVNGGLIGGVPDLINANNGNLPHEMDFRSVYGTILQDWFGFSSFVVQETLFGFPFQKLNFIANPSTINTEGGEQPKDFELKQNYPNPFNPATTIRYTLGQTCEVRLDVIDMQGKHVETLINQTVDAGSHEVNFDAGHLPSGTYLYRLQAGSTTQTRKMVLLR